MSKQQTAINYLVEKLIKLGYLHSENYGQSQVVKKVIEQAKEMEKEQLLDMGNQFAIMGEDSPEQYFNETYKSE